MCPPLCESPMDPTHSVKRLYGATKSFLPTKPLFLLLCHTDWNMKSGQIGTHGILPKGGSHCLAHCICGGLKWDVPHRTFEYFIPGWWTVCEELEGQCFLGEDMSQGDPRGFKRFLPWPLYFFSASCMWVRMWALSYCSSTMPACLPAAMVYIMVMNFLTFLCKLPWTYCFATAITKTAFVSYPEYRWLCLFPLVKEWLHNLTSLSGEKGLGAVKSIWAFVNYLW